VAVCLLEPPSRIVTKMSGGHFDGGRFTFSYRPENGYTEVDVEGEFPALPGMPEADELTMLDGFFTTVTREKGVVVQATDCASLPYVRTRVRQPNP
jgi:hypothetical protein